MPIILVFLLFLSAPAQTQELDASYDIGSKLMLLKGHGITQGHRLPMSHHQKFTLTPVGYLLGRIHRNLLPL